MRPSTWVNYRDYLDAYITPLLGSRRLQDLTPVRLNLLYGHLLSDGRVRGPGGLAPKTVQNVHRTLHRALRDAVRWDYLSRNPADGAEPPTGRRHKPHVWTAEQLRAFVDHVAGDEYYALWLLAVTTGLRRGALAGGADLKTVMERLGHTQIQTTQRYLHTLPVPTNKRSRRSIASAAPGTAVGSSRSSRPACRNGDMARTYDFARV